MPTHPNTLTRQAIRAAQRKARKTGHPLSRDEILTLRVQTVQPRRRLWLIALGLATAVLAFAIYKVEGPIWLWILLAACALFMILRGAFGRKTSLSRAVGRIAEQGADSILDRIVDAVIDSF